MLEATPNLFVCMCSISARPACAFARPIPQSGRCGCHHRNSLNVVVAVRPDAAHSGGSTCGTSPCSAFPSGRSDDPLGGACCLYLSLSQTPPTKLLMRVQDPSTWNNL